MKISQSPIHLSAYKISQPIGVFYLAVISAQELTKISYADIRRMEIEQESDTRRDVEKYLGIQRPLSNNRVTEIKQYVQAADAAFPTSVILSIDERCVEWNEDRQVLTLKPYVANPNDETDQSISMERVAQILDGQHRVKGLEEWKEENGSFDLPVSIFVGADIATQATIFATVNLTQTKVNKSLVYDLFEFAQTRSPQKTAHNVAILLDEDEKSPFYHRIKRLGVATEGRFAETLTQASFVSSLLPYISANPNLDRQVLLSKKQIDWPKPSESAKYIFRTLFIREKDAIIAKIIWEFFGAVEKKWPKAWNDSSRGAVLPKTNGFKAMMRLLKPIYFTLGKHIEEVATANEVYDILAKSTLKDEDFTIANFVPGSSGESDLYKKLITELKLVEKAPADFVK